MQWLIVVGGKVQPSKNLLLFKIGRFCFPTRTVTDLVYLNMSEDFLMPILEEQSPNGILFQKDGAEGLYILTFNFVASWIESFHRSCQAQGTHQVKACTAVFLNRRAAARYRALASNIPGSEIFSWN